MRYSSSRREFLKTASCATAFGMTAASYAKVVGANDRISIGVIGCGGRGRNAHMKGVQAHQAAHAQAAVTQTLSQPLSCAAPYLALAFLDCVAISCGMVGQHLFQEAADLLGRLVGIQPEYLSIV